MDLLLSDYCQRIEYPEGSGIIIKKVLNSCCRTQYNDSFQVYIPEKVTGYKRVRKQFKQLGAAIDYAELAIKGQKRIGELFYQISPKVFYDFANGRVDKIVRGPASLYRLGRVIDEICLLKKDLLANETIRERTEKSFRSQTIRIKNRFGDSYIERISSRDVTEWIRSLKLSRRTKLNYLNTFREIYNFSLSRKYILDNPLKGITKLDIKELLGLITYREPEILTVEQTQLALKTAKKESSLGLLPALTLGLFCGLRTEEIKQMTWDKINLERRFLTVGASIAKKRRIRNVTISENAFRILAPLAKSAGLISPNNYSSEYQKKFKRLTSIAGIEWKNNAMRHSFGSYHYGLYGDSILTSREMGHRNGDDILFSHYRSLVSKNEAEIYFKVSV
jgi:integrase